jgi:UDP-N-acetylmuramoyl-tripeptide--D-alanyl-D-alanine ligase
MEIANLYQHFLTAGKVSTDTRQITEGSIFFALKGDRFNANAFAQEALQKGASLAVVDEKEFATADNILLVDDVLTTLQQLARYHRDQLKIPVIGLTGSNGKTTSKELIASVLSKKYKTYATKGNLNNHIGVPLTLLSIDASYEMAVVEMGANHLGEIALLCSIANPTHGLITNIGKAHIGTFGGYENIIRAKSELYQHLIHNKGVVFINSQNPILSNMAKRFESAVFYPAQNDFYHCTFVEANPYVKIKTELNRIITSQLIGSYNFENIAAALCIGKHFGVDPTLAADAIEGYQPSNMRSQVVKTENNTVILDAYNANPSSMEAAIENMDKMNAENKVLILGDMFELEEEAAKEHRAIGQLIAQGNFASVYFCGKLFEAAKDVIPTAKFFTSKENLIAHLKNEPIIGATILVKASRGIGLESIVSSL